MKDWAKHISSYEYRGVAESESIIYAKLSFTFKLYPNIVDGVLLSCYYSMKRVLMKHVSG